MPSADSPLGAITRQGDGVLVIGEALIDIVANAKPAQPEEHVGAIAPVTAARTITAAVGQDGSGTVTPTKMMTIAGVHPAALIPTQRQGWRTRRRNTNACAVLITAPITSPSAAAIVMTRSGCGAFPPPGILNGAGAEANAQPTPATRTVVSVHAHADRLGYVRASTVLAVPPARAPRSARRRRPGPAPPGLVVRRPSGRRMPKRSSQCSRRSRTLAPTPSS